MSADGALRRGSCLAVAAAALLASPLSASPAEATPATPGCNRCSIPSGTAGEIRTSLGYVDEGAAKFGEYRDLEHSGPVAAAGLDLRWLGDGGLRASARGSELGLDSGELAVAIERQGRFRLWAGYDGIVRHLAEGAVTPLRRTDDDRWVLPADWQPAETTDAMVELFDALQRFDLETRRERLAGGVELLDGRPWRWQLQARREQREGTRAIGAPVVTDVTVLPARTDWLTHTLDTTLSRRGRKGRLAFGYHASWFDDDSPTIRFDNPFLPAAPGADAGQLAGPPDNRFQQFRLSMSRRFGGGLHFAGDVTGGRAEQDAEFAPVTINPQLGPLALPADDLDGRVDTASADARLAWRTPWRGVSVTADYHLRYRDDDSDRGVFPQVLTDAFPARPRRSLGVSYRRADGGIRLDWRLGGPHALAGGVRYESFDRSYRGHPETRETRAWLALRTRFTRDASLRLEVSHGERTGEDQQPSTGQPDSPPRALRWWDVADRTRDELELALDLTPWGAASVSLSATWRDENYDDTILGRTAAERFGYTLDASVTPAADIVVYGWASREHYRTQQTGPGTVAFERWHGEAQDTFVDAGLGAEWREARPGLTTGLELVHSEGEGEVRLQRFGAFPELRTRRTLLRLHADFEASEHWHWRAEVAYEDFDTDDWQRDRLTPTTLARVLTLGEPSLDYGVWSTVLTAAYRF